MAIAKKPQRNHLAAKQEAPDDAAEKFIAGATSSREEASQEERKKVPIMVRFDRALLQRVIARVVETGFDEILKMEQGTRHIAGASKSRIQTSGRSRLSQLSPHLFRKLAHSGDMTG